MFDNEHGAKEGEQTKEGTNNQLAACFKPPPNEKKEKNPKYQKNELMCKEGESFDQKNKVVFDAFKKFDQ